MHIALSIWEKQIIISAYPPGDHHAGRRIFIWTYNVLFLMSVCPYIFQPVLVRKYIYIYVCLYMCTFVFIHCRCVVLGSGQGAHMAFVEFAGTSGAETAPVSEEGTTDQAATVSEILSVLSQVEDADPGFLFLFTDEATVTTCLQAHGSPVPPVTGVVPAGPPPTSTERLGQWLESVLVVQCKCPPATMVPAITLVRAAHVHVCSCHLLSNP